jgi:hypothetical protein
MNYFFCALFITFQVSSATVLFLGDSHSVGPFGQAFDQHLRDDGHAVATFASCGSIPKWWMTGQRTTCGYFSRDLKGHKTQLNQGPTPLLSNLLQEIRPQIVVMEFGGNYAHMPSDTFVINDIRNFIGKIKASGSKCFYITNPDTRKNRHHIPRLLALIKEAVGNECPIFESHLVTRYPETGGDGIHYWNTLGTPIAKSWALEAFRALKLYWD